eukprot:366182-Chlamydomonas_euryale.AAC.8
MNKVVDEFPGRVHYVLIDIEKDPEIAEAAGVNGTPTLQLFKVCCCAAVMRAVLKRLVVDDSGSRRIRCSSMC